MPNDSAVISEEHARIAFLTHLPRLLRTLSTSVHERVLTDPHELERVWREFVHTHLTRAGLVNASTARAWSPWLTLDPAPHARDATRSGEPTHAELLPEHPDDPR